MRHLILLCLLAAFALGGPHLAAQDDRPWTAGYIDSPFITPDGETLYFAHSATAPIHWFVGDVLTWPDTGATTSPHSDFLPGHLATDTGYWWLTDLYVSYRDGEEWTCPVNVGAPVNTDHGECCPWVSADQTIMIMSRFAYDIDLNGSWASLRESPDAPWGAPVKLPGDLGDLVNTSFHNFHMTARGSLYFETQGDNPATLYYAERLGNFEWGPPVMLPPAFQSPDEDTQIWVNDAETVLYYNHRDPDSGETLLMRSQRPTPDDAWRDPISVELIGFEDDNGALVWGEPSFTAEGDMYFLRVDTASPTLATILMWAPRNPDGSFGPPQALQFQPCE